MKILKQVVEQALHMLAGFSIVWLCRWPEVGVVISIAILFARELIVQWPVERPWDTILDSAFWIAGSVTGAILWDG